MTKTGMRITPKSGNSLSGFTAYKVYEVISGTGEANMSSVSSRFGLMQHSEQSANVVDDEGKIRFVTMDFFREFRLESGILFQ